MSIRPSSNLPAKLPLHFRDRQIIDTCQPKTHQTILAKLPVFVPITATPVPRVVPALIGKPHRDPILFKRPQLLYESIFGTPFKFGRVTAKIAPNLDHNNHVTPLRWPRVVGEKCADRKQNYPSPAQLSEHQASTLKRVSPGFVFFGPHIALRNCVNARKVERSTPALGGGLFAGKECL